MRTIALAILALAFSAQAADVDAVLGRLDGYLERYEGDLGSLLADEDFRQEIPGLPGNGPFPRPQQRRLESEVAFLRLPGDAEWIGFRRVKRVDRKPVDDRHQSLAALLSVTSSDTVAQAKLLVAQSSEYNLGDPRTINLPNLPLELLSRQYRHRFEITHGGKDKVRGRPVDVLEFSELGPPPIVYNGGYELQSHVRAWIDVQTGALWRAEVVLKGNNERREPSKVRVEFALAPQLQVIVPIEMREEFSVANGNGRGVAKYSNFRRFQTSARIVPPPP